MDRNRAITRNRVNWIIFVRVVIVFRVDHLIIVLIGFLSCYRNRVVLNHYLIVLACSIQLRTDPFIEIQIRFKSCRNRFVFRVRTKLPSLLKTQLIIYLLGPTINK